jgi:hypothetical protein
MKSKPRKAAGKASITPLVRCSSCRFCEDIGTHWEGYSVGICHRFPPRCKMPTPDPDGYEQPLVAREGDWCGEHTPNASGEGRQPAQKGL